MIIDDIALSILDMRGFCTLPARLSATLKQVPVLSTPILVESDSMHWSLGTFSPPRVKSILFHNMDSSPHLEVCNRRCVTDVVNDSIEEQRTKLLSSTRTVTSYLPVHG